MNIENWPQNGQQDQIFKSYFTRDFEFTVKTDFLEF